MLRIAVLAENSCSGSKKYIEQGLSILVMTPEKRILFDTAQSSVFLRNAAKSGLNLSNLDTVVLSHCHYSHTGGLPYLIQQNKQVHVYAHPEIFRKCFTLTSIGQKRRDCIFWDKEELYKAGAAFHLDDSPVQITNSIMVTGQIPKTNSFEALAHWYYTEETEGCLEDEMKDEQALIVNTPKGLVIITGCAHVGIINIIKYAVKLTGVQKIHALLGGMHLNAADDERIDKTIYFLRELKVANIFPLHCTGENVYKKMSEQLGNVIRHAKVGNIIKI